MMAGIIGLPSASARSSSFSHSTEPSDDIIVTGGTPATAALQRKTRTIPMVYVAG
jgi:ABC-type uncharacterized transport system substrate-binding protein